MVVINNHNDLARRYTLLLDRLHGCNKIIPSFFCVSANYNRNIKCCATHSSPPFRCRVTEAELRRTSCHTRVRARLYMVDTSNDLCSVSNEARAYKLVPAPTVRRAKAKGSLFSELIPCLTAQ